MAKKKKQITPKEIKLLKSKLAGVKIGSSVREFGTSGLKPIDMTFEQQAMQDIMGGGANGSIWGANDAVRINHDLNPRMSGRVGADETARIFGLK